MSFAFIEIVKWIEKVFIRTGDGMSELTGDDSTDDDADGDDDDLNVHGNVSTTTATSMPTSTTAAMTGSGRATRSSNPGRPSHR